MLRFINTHLASAPHGFGSHTLSMFTIVNMLDFPTGAAARTAGH